MHASDSLDLPDQGLLLRERIFQAPDLEAAAKERILALYDRLPLEHAICHGDFHPLNLVVTGDRLIVIDWFNATRGHPLADVARTSMLFKLTGLPKYADPGLGPIIDQIRAQFFTAYIRRYGLLRPFETQHLVAWTLPVAAARLAGNISAAERRLLLALIQALLKKEEA